MSVNGRLVKEFRTEINQGMNELIYVHGYGIEGNFIYSLYVDGQKIANKKNDVYLLRHRILKRTNKKS